VGVGDYDQIECVLRSIGIDESEFTDPSGPGAVHLYDNGKGASQFPQLLGDASQLADYNLVFVNCTSNLFDSLSNKMQAAGNIYNYVQSGGRLYVTDWSYDYLEQVAQLAPYIYFEGGGTMTTPQPPHAAAKASDASDFDATVGDETLAAWLKVAAPGQVSGSTVRIQDLLAEWALIHATADDQVSFPSQTWVHGNTNGADRPLTVTFDINGCGKVLYSSYHTREPGGAALGQPFPMYCKSTPTMMIAQEKILEYLILQISACVGPIG
jgi:hypothetical protein